MPPKASTKRNELKNKVKHLTATVTGAEAPMTPADRAKALNCSLEAASTFIAAAAKIPNLEPGSIRRLIAFGTRYRNFVIDAFPSLVNKSAAFEHMPNLIKHWLYREVETSPERTRVNSVNRLNDKGEVRDKLYMAGATLRKYQMAAFSLVACYIHPFPGDAVIRKIHSEISMLCRNLCTFFDLARPINPPNVMYTEELRKLLEKILGRKVKEGDVAIETEAADLQTCVMLLVHLYTGCRTGALTSSEQANDLFLRWFDVSLAPDRNDAGVIVGIKMELTLRHWKGYLFLSKLIIRYRIGGTMARENMLLDLPCYMFAHAYRNCALEGPSNLEDYFKASYSANEYSIKKEYAQHPVFWRSKPKGLALDHTGPLSGNSAGRIVRRHMTMAGLRLASDPTISLYAIRKGFLTRNYLAPDIGPALTRQMAGHVAKSLSIENRYLSALQDFNFTRLAGLDDGLAQGKDPLYLRAGTYTPKTVKELAKLDINLSEYIWGEWLLRDALQTNSDEWKSQHPFCEDPDEDYAEYSLEDTIELWQTYRALVRDRTEELRRQEYAGALTSITAQTYPDYTTRTARIEESKAESPLTRDLELRVLKRVHDQQSAIMERIGDTEVVREFDEVALQSEQTDEPTIDQATMDAGHAPPPTVPGIAPEMLGKFAMITRLVTQPAARKTCRLCEDDETVSLAEQRRLYTDTLLARHQILPDDGHTGADQFHTPLKKTLRWLLQQGMDRNAVSKAKTPLICTLPHPETEGAQCGHSMNPKSGLNVVIFKHLNDHHRDHLPDDLRTWVVQWRKDETKRTRKSNKKYKRGDHVVIPRDKVMTFPAVPLLSASYHMMNRSTSTASRQFNPPSLPDLKALLSRDYAHPALENPDHPVVPTSDQAKGAVEERLVKRLGELRGKIPKDLFKEDGYTLNLPGDNPYATLDAADYRILDEVTEALGPHLDALYEAAE